MNVKTYYNNRNEAASTDGKRWWAGSDADEATILLNGLQPISELFPKAPNGNAHSVAKARSVFISALRKSAPMVAPDNDAERAILRAAWDAAAAFAAVHDIAAAGVPVFDCKLMLVGAADAVIKSPDGTTWTYCYALDGYEWRGETNALVHIFHRGFPVDCADDPHGRYTLRELSRALIALTLRDRTEWYAQACRNQPF